MMNTLAGARIRSSGTCAAPDTGGSPGGSCAAGRGKQPLCSAAGCGWSARREPRYRDICIDRRASGAFTVVEVLLALGLMALILAVLWSVFGVFNRFFEIAPVQAAQAQLVLSLAQQLAEDLNCAIEDSPLQDPNRPSAGQRANAGSVRRFGLLGNSDSLRIDVLQPGWPAKVAYGLAGSAELDAYGQATGPRVPELRTIFYRLVSAASEDYSEEPTGAIGGLGSSDYGAGATGKSGLVRWELDFETPVDPETLALVEELGLDPQMLYEPGTLLPSEQQATWVTEVVGLRFRYFDGKSWSSSWNSLQRKSLPVAMEVSFQLQTPERPFVPRPIEPQPADLAQVDPFQQPDLLAEEQWAELIAGEASPPPTYRFVIHLAAARTRPELIVPEYLLAWDEWWWEDAEQSAPQTSDTPQPGLQAEAPAPIVPRYRPPSPQPAAGLAQPRPDQWMRSGP